MPRRILEGQVVSNKASKTITVLVERKYRHPVYKKYIKRTDKYAAHDELGHYQVGDKVKIIECRPISKTKRWTVVTDIGQAAPASAPAQKAEVKKEAPKKAPAKKSAAKKKG
jgi:small subunit ribosomal protein S17